MAHAADTRTIDVAPDGPVESRLAAQWQRMAERRGDGPQVLNLLPGRHQLDAALRLASLPAGSPRHPITIRGNGKAVISGGTVISGWKPTAEGSWAIPWTGPAVRELFGADGRIPRARFPAEGWLRIESAFPDRRSGFTADCDLPALGRGAELVFLHDWSVSRITVAGIDGRKLRTVGPIGFPAAHYAIDHFEPHPRYCLENDPAILTVPGTWCHDPANQRLLYKPRPQDDIARFAPIVPVLPRLLDLTGTPENHLPAIRFEGVGFEHCRWDPPAAGYAEGQATKHEPRGQNTAPGDPHTSWQFVPWAVEVAWADGVVFTRCRFARLGGSGVLLGAGTRDCAIDDCTVEDVSGNGLGVGEGAERAVADGAGTSPWWRVAPDQVASGNRIARTTITRCGRQFHGAVGIWVGLARDTRIEANHLHDLTYTGISVGWMWNDTPTPCGGNQILGNHIHHVMQLLSDGGGIYTLGRQPGTVLAGNHIHDIPVNLGRAESNGMFLDEGSTGLLIERNIIHGLARAPLRFHRAGQNDVRDNIWTIPDGQVAIRFNNTPEANIHAESNTVVPEAEASRRAAANPAGGADRP